MANKNVVVEPRKRPDQTRSTATVEAVLEAAAHILHEQGLAAFNTNDVARRAGVSIGSLYQYYPNKEAILAEIIRRKRTNLFNGMKAAVAASDTQPFEATIRKMVEVKIALQLRGHNMARALDYAYSTLPLRHESEDLNTNIINLIANFLSAHNVDTPQEAARDVVAIARGMIEAAALAGETDHDSLAERTCQAIRGYLAEGESNHLHSFSDTN